MARLIGYLLLAFCLILNGIGTATLATAPMTHGSVAVHSEPSAATAGDDCHEMAGVTGHPSDAVAPAAVPSEPDCCDPQQPCGPAACDDVCTPHAIAMAIVLPGAGSEDLGHRYRVLPVPERDDPALGQPVRPPIA